MAAVMRYRPAADDSPEGYRHVGGPAVDSRPCSPPPTARNGARELICKSLLAYSLPVADVFRALDDETRRLILDGLAAREGQTLFEICALLHTQHGLGSTRQAISQHLAVLEDAGLVMTERRGRSKFHYFNSQPLTEITKRWPIARKEKP